MKKQFFFVDAECDGLYGKFLSVAAIVADKDGNEIDSFYSAVRTVEEEIESDWVKENVYPYLKNAFAFYDNEKDMLEAFWLFWLEYRADADCIAYVPYPVESRLFTACVTENVETRQLLAPFPLYDLATLLESRGIFYDCDIKSLSEMELCSHDAMNDVRMMSEVWRKLFD